MIKLSFQDKLVKFEPYIGYIFTLLYTSGMVFYFHCTIKEKEINKWYVSLFINYNLA